VRSRGFTLVEILVVLVIIGVVAGAVMITAFGGGESRLANQEIQRIELVAARLRDESVLRTVEYGLRFHAGGYQTLVWDGQQWTPESPGHAWSPAVRAELVVNGRAVALANRLPSGPAQPQIAFLSSGEADGFVLTLRAGADGERLVVHSSGLIERERLGQ
jgi:general secretion pathway protein H